MSDNLDDLFEELEAVDEDELDVVDPEPDPEPESEIEDDEELTTTLPAEQEKEVGFAPEIHNLPGAYWSVHNKNRTCQ